MTARQPEQDNLHVPPTLDSATTERRVFHPAFETMARAVGLDAQPALVNELREKAGYDRSQPREHYPPEVAQQVLDLLARRCFSALAPEEAYEAFGRKAFAAYRSTLVGQVVMAALSLVGVEKALRLAVRGFQSTANFAQHEIQLRGPRELVYRAHRSIMPPRYVLGLLKELMLASRHPEVHVAVDSLTAEYTDYALRWP